MAGIFMTAEHHTDLKSGKQVKNIIGTDHASEMSVGDIIDAYTGRSGEPLIKDPSSTIGARVTEMTPHRKGMQITLVKA